MSVFNQIEAGIGTDLKALQETADATRIEISKADRALAEFLKGEDLKALGIDMDNLEIDPSAAIAEEENPEPPQPGNKKFVSPYLDAQLMHDAEAMAAASPKTKKKKKFFSGIIDKDTNAKKITKKDLKTWNERLKMMAAEVKTKHGLTKLLEVYKNNPAKGSVEAMSELGYQIAERERKIRVLQVGLDQVIPPELYNPEQKEAYEKIFDHTQKMNDLETAKLNESSSQRKLMTSGNV